MEIFQLPLSGSQARELVRYYLEAYVDFQLPLSGSQRKTVQELSP